MPTPKRRKTHSRTHHGRAHWKRTDAPANTSCEQCRKPKLPHRVCPHCGTYKGREIITLD